MAFTHEQRMELARKMNKEIAASKKAGVISTQDLITADTITPEEISELVALYPEWQAGVVLAVNDLVAYNDILYKTIQAHTTQIDWTPDTTPALFVSKAPAGVIPEFVQPTGAQDAYKLGDKVMFEGQIYQSLIDANVWSPTAYPAGWQLIS